MSKPRNEISVLFEIVLDDFNEIRVNGEKVRTFRLYNDNVWELLDEDTLPILQGEALSWKGFPELGYYCEDCLCNVSREQHALHNADHTLRKLTWEFTRK